MTEEYKLTWTNCDSVLRPCLKNLWQLQDLVDVSLAAEDQQEEQLFHAHKVILAASSDFFRNILVKQSKMGSSNPSPIIYLRGVSTQELIMVLDYIYTGEVKVNQNDLDAFLAVAEDLKLKGFDQKSSKSPPKKSRKRAFDCHQSHHPKPENNDDLDLKKPHVVKETFNENDDDPLMSEPVPIVNEEGETSSWQFQPDLDDIKQSLAAALPNALEEIPDVGTQCKQCRKIFANYMSAKVHFRDLHFYSDFNFVCPQCETVFRSRGSLSKHISHFHKGLRGVNMDLCAIRKTD